MIEQHQARRIGGCQHMRQRPADAARGAGEQHAPAADELGRTRQVADEFRAARAGRRRGDRVGSS